MCAIIGQFSSQSLDQEIFLARRDSMTHRGPDDGGFWVNQNKTIILGHRRLSILDLSEHARQPILSACGRYVMVFNGEVYNYIEIKHELEIKGCTFVGSGDSEVVLAAYIMWGDSCLDRFNGMFAIAILDVGTAHAAPSLFLARDRAGKKPLYYSHQNKNFAFASELKAIPSRMHGGLSLSGLNYYLALGYIPGAHSILNGVAKLPPGYAGRFWLNTGRFDIWRWWALPQYKPVEPVNPSSLLEEAEFLLRDAVRLRLRSDVPVGILLSGGLDSSLVVACAAEASSQPIETFTIGLPGSELDETAYANLVASHFGTHHHILNVPKASLEILDEIAPFIDEPLADSSIIPAYLVSKLTRAHVKVALGGDGGDELFGGYSDYSSAFQDEARFGWLPPCFFHSISRLAAKLPIGVRGRNRLSALRGGPFQSLIWGGPYFDIEARRKILMPEAVAALGEELAAPELFLLNLFETGCNPLDSMTRTHFGSILPDDFLVKVDRSSMAVSLELRCPLLDMRLVEFAFGRLPTEWKVVGSDSRRLQKMLGKKMLPAALDINRKQGFSIPLNDWLRAPDAKWHLEFGERLPSAINLSAVNKLIAGHAKGRANGARIFALMMLRISVQNLFLK